MLILANMSDLQETAAKHQLVAEDHRNIAEESLRFQQRVRDQDLTDRQKECLHLFRLTKSTQDATYEWYKDRVEDRVEGTCEWFLQHAHFQEWLQQVSGPLLVSADPGCGKSVLAKYLTNHVLAESATVCYFFFKDQDQNTVRQAESQAAFPARQTSDSATSWSASRTKCMAEWCSMTLGRPP